MLIDCVPYPRVDNSMTHRKQLRKEKAKKRCGLPDMSRVSESEKKVSAFIPAHRSTHVARCRGIPFRFAEGVLEG